MIDKTIEATRRHRLRNEITAEAARRALAATVYTRANRLKIYEDAIAELSKQYGFTEDAI